MQTAVIKVNVNKANELMFYLKDSHDAFLTLAKRAETKSQRIMHAENAKKCRQYYKNAADFSRLIKQVH
ncbi:hypothetical protein ACFGYG_04760 [Pasteurella multocida]|nr:hypothetical protein [Pasteurella multocida]HDR1874061.1 hypothetical protein [Pasteurella multocida]HDR1894421.1 hypothetical protein [Pasteurella multocida]HED4406682.1 hypothetical protein [Pasteurella multocida]